MGVEYMFNFVLCDDNEIVLKRISKMLESIFIKNNFEAQITFESTSGEELLSFVKNHEDVQVIILDIHLKSGPSGIEIAQKIRENNKNVYIIFTTGHLEYAMIAFKVKTFDYLAKPITVERLEETVIRLFNDAMNNPKHYLRLGNNSLIINQDEIDYIKREGMKVVFYTPTRTYEAYSSFKKLSPCLSDNFIRCHKSYVANVNRIKNIEPNSNTISFSDTSHCYIGPKYKNKIMEVMKNHGNI